MVTVAQLRAERKRAFRAVRRNLNVFQKTFNLLHRELNKRLEKHNVELLDLQDAQKIIEVINEADDRWQNFKYNTGQNLEMFFQ